MKDLIKKFDWILVVSTLFLVGIGLFSLYSFSLAQGDFSNFRKQIIFLTIGFFLMIAFSLLDYRIFKTNPYFILSLYFLSLVLLAGLFFFAPEIRGIRTWYKIGPFSFNPIEVARIVLIILLAKYFSMRHVEMYRMRHILISGMYVVLPSFLIFIQPNPGSVIALIALWLAVLIVSGIKVRHFMILALIFLLFLVFSWSFLLRDYQKARIVSFVFPQEDLLRTGWQQRQARIAIGAGGLWGRGITRGTQTQYGFLPEPQTDFIFAALAEKLGFLGICFIFLLFSILLWRIIRIALFARGNFPRLFAVGIAASLFSEIFINIGMNLGLLPVIGISLPFVSYGGSALIMNFVGLGILQSTRIS